jgi:hypothetical protein
MGEGQGMWGVWFEVQEEEALRDREERPEKGGSGVAVPP